MGETIEAEAEERPAEVGGIEGDRLQSLVDRIERNRTEMQPLKDHEKDLFAEAKSAGFDVKVLRQMLKRREKERAEIEEADELLSLYERAVGG